MKGRVLIKALLLIIVGVFLFNQIYSSAYKPIVTQGAAYSTESDGLVTVGTIIRGESYVNGIDGGVLHFTLTDCERVAKGGTVAEVYANEGVSSTVTRISDLKDEIANIEGIKSYNNVEAADLDLASEKTEQTLADLNFVCSTGDFADVKESSREFLSAINRRQIITGEADNFDERLNTLKSELAALSSSLPQATGRITAQSSGYFVPSTDGYETVLKSDNIDAITPEYLDSLKPQKTEGNIIGKIVSDYEWYIAAKTSIGDSYKYKVDEKVVIKTSVSTCPRLNAVVKKINVSNSGDSAVIIFSCNQMNGELASLRTVAMSVVTKEYSGLKVSRRALRVVDGVAGVYVVSGIELKFVPVNVIFKADDYIICEQKQSNTERVLRLYDEVVVKGKKLYDGKIVD